MKNDLEKLAAEMQKMKPSKISRKGGMDAAMAAFTSEFAVEAVTVDAAEKTAAIENNLETSQGLSGAARPTGQNTGTKPVDTFRSDMMSKLKSVFSFDMKTTMMMGSCAAALMFAAVIIPNSRPGFLETPPMDAVSTPVEAIEPLLVEPPKVEAPAAPNPVVPAAPDVQDEITVTARRAPAPSPTTATDADTASDAARVRQQLNEAIAKQKQDAESIAQAVPAPVREPIASLEGAVPQFEPPRVKAQSGRSAPQTPPPPQIQRQQALQGKTSQFSQGYVKAAPPPPVISRMSRGKGVKTSQIASMSRSQGGSIAVQASAPKTIKLPNGLTFEEVPGEAAASPQVNANGQFTVFNGVSEQVIESTETTVTQTGEILARVLVPARYKTISKQVLISPETVEEIVIPAVTKDFTVKLANDDGTFREVINTVVIEPERIDYVITPAKYETRSERILIAPAEDEWKPGSQALNVIVPAPPKFILRDDDGNVVREFENRDAFEIYKANLPTLVSETPVSTFSVDVDTASYSFFRSSVNRGQLPPASSVRVEEMINYFSYDYDAPRSADEPFKANVTVTPTPWNADTKLMRIGIKGYVLPVSERPDSNIVFLIDTSGSMRQANKLPLLINSFKLLLNTLGEDDTVSIVTYAGSAGTVLEPTAASDKNKIIAALNNLRAGGSTAGAAGLELAYNKAMESFDKDGTNRVILATDGDFNVGFSSPDAMKTYITEKRKTGIFLSVLGFGSGNYKDDLMQSLAQNGNGTAAYIDTLAEANKVLADESGSALITIAKDVKIQVEFNPDTIAEYRLIGYETRALKRQDFNNDAVDAGEINAGHNVTALYELTPVGSPARVIDDLRYVADSAPKSSGSDELAFVKIRHKLPNADTSTLQTFPVGPSLERNIKRASDDMRFAAAVAAVGQKLRGDTQLANYSYADAIKLAKSGKGDDENGYRAEFIQLLRLVDTMEK